ncbi:Crp/Fnr family transcriptional regulator [Methyloradius palustris]|uniref:Crp/Fnr family transcriptional regulator n=1 Tax=Methyloradius palustris TaxID=2778876 RepID=A0A8D5GDM0_9PROT|nr:Crp/Fnr family transcriptional regulator [Methyloradius palustris]BCM24684.1 Crp/Fnr family transcriptional regulator [Methyloradius palustris]
MPELGFTDDTNNLLSGLPGADRKRFIESCEAVTLVLGNVLCEVGEPIQHVYFPTESIISLVMPLDSGTGLEVGLIGNEGMYGLPLVLGVNIAPFHSQVQGAGPALRIERSTFIKVLGKSLSLERQLKRYVYVLMRQLGQTAACNRFHLVEERMARWLLMTRDRAHSSEFHITQEFLAQMLGVRRVGVTKAARSLQRKSLISYSRGNMKIHDSEGLERAACSCYHSDKQIYYRILNG